MLVSLILAAQVAATPPSDLDWLAGYWLSCDGGREVAETWSDARGGVLFNTTINLNGARVSAERAAVTTVEGALAFVYEPSGPSVVFPAIAVAANEVTFENLQNGFPHRVIYRREGDVLTGRIEGTIDGQARSMEWVYRAAALNTRCPGIVDEAG